MSRSTAAHRAQVVGTRSLVSFPTFFRVLATLVVAIALALVATSGSYAFLSSSAPVKLLPGNDAVNVRLTAGTSSITISSPALDFTGFYPGLTRAGDATVTAAGAVNLSLSVASTTGTSASGFSVTVAPGLCSANAAAVASGPLGIIVAPGSTAAVCVRVGLATSSPATAVNTSTALSAVISGAQA
jgi:hypothetical protein